MYHLKMNEKQTRLLKRAIPGMVEDGDYSQEEARELANLWELISKELHKAKYGNFKLARKQEQAAMNKYHQRYNNHLYTLATKGKDQVFCNKLIDSALAVCGHPCYTLSQIKWDPQAEEFLRLFDG